MGFSAGTVATVPDGGATVASAVSIMGNVTPTGGLRCGHGYNTTPKTTIQRLFRQQLDPSFSFFLCLVLFFFLSPPPPFFLLRLLPQTPSPVRWVVVCTMYAASCKRNFGFIVSNHSKIGEMGLQAVRIPEKLLGPGQAAAVAVRLDAEREVRGRRRYIV